MTDTQIEELIWALDSAEKNLNLMPQILRELPYAATQEEKKRIWSEWGKALELTRIAIKEAQRQI